MELMTEELRRKLPPLYSQENVRDPMVWVKYFHPASDWTWYGIEFDGEDIFFGWVCGFEDELGYFSLKELQEVKGPMGLGIERDLYFEPAPLSEIQKRHRQQRWLASQTSPINERSMSKKPLYPHVPKKKAPLYPHVTRGQQPQNKLANNEEEEVYNVIASDFISELSTGGWKKQLSEMTTGRYFLEVYWEPWLYEAGRAEYWGKYFDNLEDAESIYDSLTNIRKVKNLLNQLPMTVLAKTEGDPISKYCCQLCGECAPEELLEEGRFLDRISWLRRHYKEKHPGMWGKMSPMTVEGGEPIPPEYRHLAGLVNEPLPKDAY